MEWDGIDGFQKTSAFLKNRMDISGSCLFLFLLTLNVNVISGIAEAIL